MALVFNKSWWGHLCILFFGVITFTTFLQFDPVFNPQNDLLLVLLPLVWGSIAGTVPSFKPDPVVITPKNIMLFIWFNKLIIIPLEIIYAGNMIPVETHSHQEISIEIITVIISFVAFVLGWSFFPKNPNISTIASLYSLKIWTGVYSIIAFVSIFLLYGSLSNYWSGAIFTYVTLEIVEQNGTLAGLLTNVGQRFLPFSVMLAWYEWQKKKLKIHKLKHIAWLLLCLAGSLSSNRSNMIYPSLTLLSIICVGWKTRYLFWWALLFSASIILLFFFGYVRVQPSLDTEVLEMLLEDFLERKEYILQAHQLYIGSPYQITPLLSIHPASPTLLASFLEPIPIIGKAFREQSGPHVYNLVYHYPLVAQDKVIPVMGELYYNGGYVLVAVGYILFGIVYRWLDVTFKANAEINPPVAASFFYLSLLFSATLLLSLSVLMQFMVYNAAPALLIIAANWSRIRKAS